MMGVVKDKWCVECEDGDATNREGGVGTTEPEA